MAFRNAINTGFVLIALLLMASCRGKQKEPALPEPQIESAVSDSTFLFNGKDLSGWEITNFGPQGAVYVSGAELILGMGDGCTGVTWQGEFPTDDYRVSLKARRVNGNDFFCGLTFAVGDEPCTFIAGGWGGTIVGLSCIDGMDASENETTSLMQFSLNRWYDICVVVAGDSVIATIDKQRVVAVSRAEKTFSVRPEVELSRPFGIATWCTTAAIKEIRVEKL
jgi:hypothetical protein